MVIGASWMGARSFTPTSGPGISLMSEFIGLAYYAEIPAVVFDVQRTGPSTGMPTRTQQGDLMLCAYASHGDTKHICLYPANPEECFTMAVEAFDLADRFQTPVFVLSDLDIGMNDWMCKELTWDDAYRPDRGKVLDAAALDKVQNYYRYLDSDGDGIPYRTLPGTHPKGAFFTRGSGHNKLGGYTEDSDRVHGSRRPRGAQDRERGGEGARNRSSRARATSSGSSPSAATTARRARRSRSWRAAASTSTIAACADSRSRRRFATSSTRTSASSSSSPIATRSS